MPSELVLAPEDDYCYGPVVENPGTTTCGLGIRKGYYRLVLPRKQRQAELDIRLWLDRGVICADDRVIGLDLRDMRPTESAKLIQRHGRNVRRIFIETDELCHTQVVTAIRALRSSHSLGIWVDERSYSGQGYSCLAALNGVPLQLRLPHRVNDADLKQLAKLRSLRGLVLLRTQISAAGMASISGLRHLRFLRLNGSGVSDATLKYLGNLSRLRALSLAGNPNITDAGLVHLQALTRLERLDLSGVVKLAGGGVLKGTSIGVRGPGLARLWRLKRLRTLDISFTSVTNKHLRHLSQLPRLESLDLEHSRITDEGLALLRRLPLLRRLNLRHTRTTDAGLAHLKGLTRLKVLLLRNTRVTNRGLQYLRELTGLRELRLPRQITCDGLSHIGNLRQLRVLDLRQTAVRSRCLRPVGRLSHLQELYMPRTRYFDDGRSIDYLTTSAGLHHLRFLRRLRVLDLFDFKNTSDDWLLFAKHLKQLRVLNIAYYDNDPKMGTEEPEQRDMPDRILTSLTRLNQLRVLRLGSVAIGRIRPLRNLRHLRTLGIEGAFAYLLTPGQRWIPRLTEVEAASDAGLLQIKRSHNLLRLNLAQSDVTDQGVSIVYRFKNLRWLDLRSCSRVTDRGVRRFAGLRHLRYLDLSGTAISDAALPTIGHLHALRHLGLWGTAITDAGVKHLMRLKRLKELRINTSQITCRGYLALKRALPNTSIDWYDHDSSCRTGL